MTVQLSTSSGPFCPIDPTKAAPASDEKKPPSPSKRMSRPVSCSTRSWPPPNGSQSHSTARTSVKLVRPMLGVQSVLMHVASSAGSLGCGVA